MNVAFDPWIPVIDNARRRILVSLCDVLMNGEMHNDLAVRPHERVALMRLFLCTAHAALEGPKNYGEWCSVPRLLPDAAKAYLERWRDSFELYHPHKPWLQVAALRGIDKGDTAEGKTAHVSLLDFELANGNNSTLMDHGGQLKTRHLEAERVAINLLTFLNFSSGGGSPVAQWNTTKTKQVGNPDSPCLSQSMAHCLFRGSNIRETICLNMPTYQTVGQFYRSVSADKTKGDGFTSIVVGRPVWECFPQSPRTDTEEVRNAVGTYLGRLVPIARWIRLIPESDSMYCCNGFKFETFKDGFAAEPTASSRLVSHKDKKGNDVMERRVVKADPEKAVWRELSSLIVKRSADGLGGPLAMENAPTETGFDFHICAMTRDQASMDIAIDSVFHISPAFWNNRPVYQTEIVGDGKVTGAEGHARKLRWAIEKYRMAMDDDWPKRIKRTKAADQTALRNRLCQTALLSYWTAVEKNLPHLMTHIDAIGTEVAIPTRKTWRKILFTAALDAYRISCGQETPRQIRAYAHGLQVLTDMQQMTVLHSTDNQEENE